MALDFPPNPSVGYIYTYGSRSWQWNGTAWDSYSTATNPVTSLNGLTGSVGLSAGISISITTTGNTLTIAYTGSTGSGITKYVESFNGLTGSVSGVSSMNGLTGSVTVAAKVAGAIGVNVSGQNIFIENQGVKSLGFTGTKGIQVQSAAGQGNTGDLQFTITYTPNTVNSFKSQTTPSGQTGDITFTEYVSSFNGLTGAVTGVTTGAANTFGPLQSFTNGISASGITVSGFINLSKTGSIGYITAPSGTNSLRLNGGGPPYINIDENDIHLNNITNEIIIGDVNGSVNSQYISVSDTNFNIQLNAPQGIVTIGDVNSGGNLTSIQVDDATSTIGLNGLVNNAFDSTANSDNRMIFFDSSISTHALKTRTWFDYTGQLYTRLPIGLANGQTMSSAVTTYNGLSGAVTGVQSFNGLTGTVSYYAGGNPGVTSGSITVYTYPDGVTTASSKTFFYQPTFQTNRDTGGYIVRANRTYFSLFFTPVSRTIQKIRMETQSTGSTGSAFFGIYSADSTTGYPSTLLYSSPSTTVAGNFSQTTVSSVNYTVPAGWFYLAVTCSLTPALYAYSKTNLMPVFGSAASSDGYMNYFPVADTTGFTLPTALPASGVTFAFIDYSPANYIGVRLEYGV